MSERLGERVRRIEDFLAANPFSMTLLIRLLPVGNNFATNLAGGRVARAARCRSCSARCSATCRRPSCSRSPAAASRWARSLRVAIAVVFFVVSGAIGIWLYRRYRHGKSLGEDVEKAI